MRTSITIWNCVQIALNLLGFVSFFGLFSITQSVGKKSALLILFAHLSCVGCSIFAILLNCYTQIINSSQRRQSDFNILLYAIYFLGAICCVGYVFYWMAILSNPPVLLLFAQKYRGMVSMIIVLNFAIMMMFTFVTYMTLNYIAGYPNGYGKKHVQYVEVKKEAEGRVQTYIMQ